MSLQHDHPPSPGLADQALKRTVAPAAHGHANEHGDDDHHEHEHAFKWAEMVRIVLVALAAAAVWFRLWEPVSAISLVGVAGLLIGGWPIFKEAVENLIAKRMTMELSMSIAIVAAAAISEFFTALVITLFVLVAEVLEGMTVLRGRRAIRDLLDFLPRAVSIRRAGNVSEVDVDRLAVGDAVLVNPGGRIPVDGTVIAGHSFVDQARITGESMPLEKTVGTPVFAGSINQSGALEIRAERIGRDTSYGKIIEAVEQAERSRAPVQRLADRLAGYLVYLALAAAALTYLLTRDIRATISVVIVAGACGIAAGTPLAILGAIGRAARAGAIVKGGLFLEQLGQVNTVVLDKTGTLTYGQPEVRTLIPVAGVDRTVLLDAAASAELRSEHPLGKTIVAYARAQERSPKEPQRFGYTPGHGIDATVDGELVLVGNQALMRDHGIAVPADLLAGHQSFKQLMTTASVITLGFSTPLSQATSWHFHYDHVLGTSVDIIGIATSELVAQAAARASLAEIVRLDKILSGWRIDSELAALNQAQTMSVSSDLYHVLEAAERWQHETGGAFNHLIGRIIELWRKASVIGKQPNEAELQRLTKALAAVPVKLEAQTRRVCRPLNVSFAIDGLAKGYIVDAALRVARRETPALKGIG